MMEYTFYHAGEYFTVYATTYDRAVQTFERDHGHLFTDESLVTNVRAA